MKYRISVLMGIYNCAPTLQEALDSLYAQTYQGFKIILCDDGSKDDTLKIALANANKHDNVVVLMNPQNMGLNYTLNNCLKHADTEFCARMDGDDVCDLTRFEKQIKFLDEHPEYAIVSSSMSMFDEKGEFGAMVRSGEPSMKMFLSSTPHCHAPAMIRTEAYKAVGGYSEDKNLLRVEDLDLWLKLYKSGYKGYNLDEKLYAMRDSREATARRSWLNRKNEARIRMRAVRDLKLPVYDYVYGLRPLILYFMPTGLYQYLHKWKQKQ